MNNSKCTVLGDNMSEVKCRACDISIPTLLSKNKELSNTLSMEQVHVLPWAVCMNYMYVQL